MNKLLTKEQKDKKNERQRNWRKNNSGKTKEYQLKHKEYLKEYYEKNKEKIKQDVKEYVINNKDKVSNRRNEYRIKNKETINKKFKERRAQDELFRLKQDMRNMLNKTFKKFDFGKSNRTENILGCTFDEFKMYIDSKLQSWMNWENKGLYNGTENYGWDIDHITPLHTAETIEYIIKLNHYTNLQPLCSYINRDIKKGRI